jgi:membrane associated rhomboid family serine protease
MSLFTSAQQPLIRCFAQQGGCVRLGRQLFDTRNVTNHIFARYASQSNRSPGSPKSSQPAQRRNSEPQVRKRQVDPSLKAFQTLLNVSKSAKKTTSPVPQSTPPKVINVPATAVEKKTEPYGGASDTIEISQDEAAIQLGIVKMRRKILWPGIWTVFALAGTWVTLAYLDARSMNGSQPTEAQPFERAEIPQTWFLTPSVVKEGIKAGWNELDKLTIGIVVASIGIHLLKRSPLPIWERLIHITGEKKYTAFTFPFVHSNWGHLAQNALGIVWFLPAVVHYLDNDLYQTAALFFSVPLFTSYLQHFAFRWGTVTGLPLNMGSSGAGAAIIGAFCAAYPDEKVWVPNFLIFRLDAKYCAALFAVMQLALMIRAPVGPTRPAFIVSILRVSVEQC